VGQRFGGFSWHAWGLLNWNTVGRSYPYMLSFFFDFSIASILFSAVITSKYFELLILICLYFADSFLAGVPYVVVGFRQYSLFNVLSSA
jgi:hypothetical protein